MRYVLIGVSVVLVGILIWQFLSDRGGFDPISDPTESVKMVNPRYSGRTGDGLPFYLTADTAVRRMEDRNTVLLQKPVLEFIRTRGAESSAVIAKTGSYNDMDKVLELNTDVNLQTDDGNSCDTTHARIFNVEKRIEGDEPIDCTGGFGQVSGQTYEIQDDYKTFVFKNGMVARLERGSDVADSTPIDTDAVFDFSFGGSGPVDIVATTGIYKGNFTDLEGNVRIDQEGSIITADQMDIFRVQQDGAVEGSVKFGAIQQIDAEGNFRYITAENDIRGSKGVYEREKNLMTVTGDVIVIQPDGNRYEAQKMTYNTKSGTVRFSGKCLGSDCDANGRVGIRIPGSKN
jgi:LPS export ABC transporter protein LptC/lipopolysaccharide transport protein LptA